MTIPMRRLRAALTSGALIAGGAAGALALTVAGAPAAFAAPANNTFNDNGCNNNISQATGPSTIPIGLGSDQTYAALSNTVDPLSGTTTIAAGNVTVANGAAATPPAALGVLQGGGASLTNLQGTGAVSGTFIDAGVNLHAITRGQVLTGGVNVLIDAGGATFDPSGQPVGVTVVSPTQVLVSGTAGATVPMTPGTALTVQIPLPNVNYHVPNTPGTVAYFYQDNVAGTLAPTGDNLGAGGSSSFPQTPRDATAQLTAGLGALGTALIACLPGEAPTPVAPATVSTFTQTAPGQSLIFAAVNVQSAQAPTLAPQTVGPVNLGGSIVIHALNGVTGNVGADPASVTVVTPPTLGTTSVNPLTGDITYTNTAAGTGDSFTVTAAAPSIYGTLVSAPVTETISGILAHPSTCDVTAQPGCSIDQIVLVPVTGADLVFSEADPTGNGLPVDLLNHTVTATGCNGPAITLNGNPQLACGAMFPVEVVNSRGTDAGWTLSGQITDFVDPALGDPGTTPALATKCDTVATYNNHCIPGGNLSWIPVAGVAHAIVAGDTAEVTPGAALLNIGSQAPSLTNTAGLGNVTAGPLGVGVGAAIAAYDNAAGHLGGSAATQTNPVTEVAAVGGLHQSAQTLCSTISGQSGGTFLCGSALIVSVPASAAAPAAPGYIATLTLTLV